MVLNRFGKAFINKTVDFHFLFTLIEFCLPADNLIKIIR